MCMWGGINCFYNITCTVYVYLLNAHNSNGNNYRPARVFAWNFNGKTCALEPAFCVCVSVFPEIPVFDAAPLLRVYRGCLQLPNLVFGGNSSLKVIRKKKKLIPFGRVYCERTESKMFPHQRGRLNEKKKKKKLIQRVDETDSSYYGIIRS